MGRQLQAAGCADPSPSAGKRTRLRDALTATQERDGHAGALLRLKELAADAEEAENERAAALRPLYEKQPSSLRAKVRARDGFSFEVGVANNRECATLTLLPDCAGMPIQMEPGQAQELVHELIAVVRELTQPRGE
ncbi:MAG: hypothetical protein ACHQC8_01665 [Solirubrobacterales bacterium]